MKSRFVIALVIIALAGIAITSLYSTVWAAEQEGEKKQTGPLPPGTKVVGQPPVEFSTLPDVDMVGVPTPQQVLYTEPTFPNFGAGIPRNTFLFGHPDYPTTDVDALANPNDFAFQALVNNTVDLLVSFQGDPGVNAVWYEAAGGPPQTVTGVLWTHANLDVAGVTLTPSRELDALEVWGPLGPGNSDDAFQFSLVGDPGGFSVFHYNGPGLIAPFIRRAVIQAACVELGYTTTGQDSVDLDALMVNEIAPGDYGVWDENDIIIFSIRNTIPGGGNWDGGEIVVYPFGGPAAFLNHGGHLWNTAFSVADTFGVPTEEVDGIEAYVEPAEHVDTPTLTQWGLIILVLLIAASAVFIMVRRRKAAVPA